MLLMVTLLGPCCVCSTALDFLQLGPDAIVLRTTDNDKLELAVAKTWQFSPGAPFVGDAMVGAKVMLCRCCCTNLVAMPVVLQVGFSLDLEQDVAGIAVQLQGAFAGVLSIDIFEDPIIDVGCRVSIEGQQFRLK